MRKILAKLRQALSFRQPPPETEEQQHEREMKALSLDRKGDGWIRGAVNPDRLYVLGQALDLRPGMSDPGGNLGWSYLSTEYEHLLRQLKSQFGFTPVRVLLGVEAKYAGWLLTDENLLQQLEVELGWAGVIDSLRATVSLNGDKVMLAIRRECRHEGYSFFVYGHPQSHTRASGADQGRTSWPRPSPSRTPSLQLPQPNGEGANNPYGSRRAPRAPLPSTP